MLNKYFESLSMKKNDNSHPPRRELANGDSITMDNLPVDIDQDVALEILDPDLQLELDRIQLEHFKLQQEQLKFKKRLVMRDDERRAVNNNLSQPTRCLRRVVRNVVEGQIVGPTEHEDIPGPPQDQPETPQERQQENEPEIELQELEEDQVVIRKRRRGKQRLIIDKKTKLDSVIMRARIDNPKVELRCERALPEPIRFQTRAIVEKIVEQEEEPSLPPVEQSAQIVQPIAERDVTALAVVDLNKPHDVTGPRDGGYEVPRALPEPIRFQTRAIVEKIVEQEEEPSLPPVEQSAQIVQPIAERDVTALAVVDLNKPHDVTGPRDGGYEVPAKRPRRSGYLSFKECFNKRLEIEANEPVHHQKQVVEPIDQDIDQENIPPEREQSQRLSELNVATMLREAGLADVHLQPETVETQVAIETRRRDHSESSETPLGSLDRTKVSLGDSVKTTESQQFIRDQWGELGTMMKILQVLRSTGSRSMTINNLMEKGPVISGQKKMIAARCFSSILKLTECLFIKVVTDPETSEIRNIKLGPVFDRI